MPSEYRSKILIAGYCVYRFVLLCLYGLLFAGSCLHHHELGSVYENLLVFFVIIPLVLVSLAWVWLPKKFGRILSAAHGLLLLLAIAATYLSMLLAHNDINSLSVVACVPAIPLIVEGIVVMVYRPNAPKQRANYAQ